MKWEEVGPNADRNECCMQDKNVFKTYEFLLYYSVHA